LKNLRSAERLPSTQILFFIIQCGSCFFKWAKWKNSGFPLIGASFFISREGRELIKKFTKNAPSKSIADFNPWIEKKEAEIGTRELYQMLRSG